MKVLVANRGEIACRILYTLREMGLPSVAVYTDIDSEAPHVALADETVCLGAANRYLDMSALLEAAERTGATAVHPGYGFLSQNPEFARRCTEAGINFIGPSPAAMAALGDKRASREIAERCGVPVVPGASICDSAQAAEDAARRVGFPVLIKAAGGGGGKGMRRVDQASGMAEAFAAAQREAKNAFADDRLLVEKYIFPARHVEVQVMGDGIHAIALGERECSLQRRYQKIVEEAPAHTLKPATRKALHEAAVRLSAQVGYANAGTVEFLVGPDESFYFLEVNTRLQVEHPITEMVTGVDIVRLQIAVATGGQLPAATPAVRGHALEARINAEDAYGGFLPASGRVAMLRWPQMPHVRIDAGIVEGSEITPQYDPMLAKMIVWAPDREQARLRLLNALRQTVILGLHTNQTFLIDLLERDFYKSGQTFTTTVEQTQWPAPAQPPWLDAAVKMCRASGSNTKQASPSGGGDQFSPWQSLGAFRMGA